MYDGYTFDYEPVRTPNSEFVGRKIIFQVGVFLSRSFTASHLRTGVGTGGPSFPCALLLRYLFTAPAFIFRRTILQAPLSPISRGSRGRKTEGRISFGGSMLIYPDLFVQI